MRIISGTARGTKLYTLDGEITRPTLDRVREAVFNIIQNEIKEAVFLDLFSGSGAIAIEAASRGAQKVISCDKSKKAINIINRNIQKTHLEEKIQVYNTDFKECLNGLINQKIDLIYLDPPYETNYIEEAIKIIENLDLMHSNTKVIIETDNEEIIKNIEKQKIKIIDKRKYGRAIIIIAMK